MRMQHSSSGELFAYWDRCRGRRNAPDRADIDPGAIRRILADTFILSLDAEEGHPFRLAGTRVCALFGGELKGEAFLSLWHESAREAAEDLLTSLERDSTGHAAIVSGQNEDGAELELELLLLPLSYRGRVPTRAIGTLAPLQMPYWLGIKPIADLVVGRVQHLGPADAAVSGNLAARPKGRTGGLIVYEGGRRD
jgi:hypothetical protein